MKLLVDTGVWSLALRRDFPPDLPEGSALARFGALPLLSPDLEDHVEAAALRNLCRRHGVKAGTIDALLAQLGIRHGLTLLSTDRDFGRIAAHSSLQLWK